MKNLPQLTRKLRMYCVELSAINKDCSCELPIYGLELVDGECVPFGDLYLDMFPEQYAVE